MYAQKNELEFYEYISEGDGHSWSSFQNEYNKLFLVVYEYNHFYSEIASLIRYLGNWSFKDGCYISLALY